MPSVLALGGRLDSVDVIAGVPTETNSAGRFDSTYCDAAIYLSDSQIIERKFLDSTNTPVDVTVGQTLYQHWEEWFSDSNGNGNSLGRYLVDSAGNPWVSWRVAASGGPIMALYYNSGTGASPVWTKLGSNQAYTANTRITCDIKLTLGSPHQIEFSVNGTAIYTGTFSQAALTNLRAFRAGSNGTGSTFYAVAVSQIMATEGRSTVNGKVPSKRATGAGGNSGWTGAATNINEAVNSDSTVDSTTTAGVRQTYAIGDITVPAGYSIVSVFQMLRAKNDGAAPSNIKSVVRQSTTNYDYASNMPGIGTSFGPLPARYDTDPASGAAWTQTTFNSAEFGYLSAA